jgi:hypothetical protein
MQEQKIPIPISLTALKTEQVDVNYVCLCPILKTFSQCPGMPVVSVRLSNIFTVVNGNFSLFF